MYFGVLLLYVYLLDLPDTKQQSRSSATPSPKKQKIETFYDYVHSQNTRRVHFKISTTLWEFMDEKMRRSLIGQEQQSPALRAALSSLERQATTLLQMQDLPSEIQLLANMPQSSAQYMHMDGAGALWAVFIIPIEQLYHQ